MRKLGRVHSRRRNGTGSLDDGKVYSEKAPFGGLARTASSGPSPSPRAWTLRHSRREARGQHAR